MFPDQTGQACVQDGPIYVEAGPGNEGRVMQAVMGTTPNMPCVTNIDTALSQVAKDPAYTGMPDASGRRGFVLLISDGSQSANCGGMARNPTIVQILQVLYGAGYPTYVLGFGGAVDAASLDSFAMAGGVPDKGGAHSYYQATNATELDAALDAIAGQVAHGEFGGCAGIPCPDGRCLGTSLMCVGGVCQSPPPDLAGADFTPAPADPEDLSSSRYSYGGDPAGCRCGVSANPIGASDFSTLLLIAAALSLARRGRGPR